MRQLAIDLPHRPPALGRGDFLVSGCNEAALGWIERWPDWPARSLVLHGPAQSGKTHLLHQWRQRSGAVSIDGAALAEAEPDRLAAGGAVALDDPEAAPELTLLHLCNCAGEAGAFLLIAARQAPAAWPLQLPDLASRLRAMPAVAILPPDDALLAALLVKHFADRQLRVQPSVIHFLVRRMERSFAAAASLAACLDRLALGAGGPVSLALARQALAAAESAG